MLKISGNVVITVRVIMVFEFGATPTSTEILRVAEGWKAILAGSEINGRSNLPQLYAAKHTYGRWYMVEDTW